MHGDGLQTRDFTYVTNAVQAMMRASAAEGVAGRTYNVGTGQRTTILDLVAALNRVLGTDLRAQHAAARAGDVRHSCADISKTQRDLGYQPQMGFEEGLERTLRWYRESK